MKKLLLLFLLIATISNAQKFEFKKLFTGNSIAVYGLAGLAGASDGLNDCVVANKFYKDKFWGYDNWVNNPSNWDGFHLTKLATYTFYSGAIAVNLSDLRNWKYQVGRGLIAFFVARGTHELIYEVVFKNYPR